MLSAADEVVGGGDEDAADEDDRGVVHGFRVDWESRRHGEEWDCEEAPCCE